MGIIYSTDTASLIAFVSLLHDLLLSDVLTGPMYSSYDNHI